MGIFEVIFMFVIFALYGVLCLIGLIGYILSSCAYHKIAARRNIETPWLAWIPLVRDYTIGRITNEYDKKNGYDRKWHKVLLILLGIFVVTFAVFYIIFLAAVVGLALKEEFYYDYNIAAEVTAFVISYIGIILSALVGSAYTAISYICSFKIYESLKPEKAIKYIILNMLVPLAGPICLYMNRNEGYSFEAEASSVESVPVSEEAEEAATEPLAEALPEAEATGEVTEETEEKTEE